MATGLIKTTPDGIWIRLVEGIATAQGKPADGAAGDVLKTRPIPTQFFDLASVGLTRFPEESILSVYETGASSGVLTISYLRLWLFDALTGKAFPAGSGTDADKGKLNNLGALGETDSDKLRHREVLYYPGDCDGVQVEFGTIAGTTPTFNADWFIPSTARK